MANKWTDEEIAILKNHYEILTDKQIASLIGTHSTSSVKSKRQELKLEKERTHKKYSFQDVLNEFAKTDYILLSSDKEYINAAENTLRYFCPRHMLQGEQRISLGHLKDGRGCYYCGREITENAHIIPSHELDVTCKNICKKKGFIYIGFVRKDGLIYIQYICPKHRDCGVQEMRKGNMERANICGCPYCMDTKKYKFSKGEQSIALFLDNNNIRYTRQYMFKDCVDQCVLPFDFYLNEQNKCIEFDGQHHYYPVCFNGISLEEAERNHEATKRHDNIKTQYCETNGIPLLRIPYYEITELENKLHDFIFNERN